MFAVDSTSRSFADPTMSLKGWHEDRVRPRLAAAERTDVTGIFPHSAFEVSKLRQERTNHAQKCKQHDQHNCFVRACCRGKSPLRDNVASGIALSTL